MASPLALSTVILLDTRWPDAEPVWRRAEQPYRADLGVFEQIATSPMRDRERPEAGN